MIASYSSGEGFVRFEAVEKTYDGINLVVKSLNLSIGRGEFLTILGPSGSGKTTTLMMLAGFESVTSGEIYLNGERINDIPPHKRGLGMVFQNYALFPHMSIAENIAFPLQVRNVDKVEIADRVRKALDMVKMSGLDTRKPMQLSGGQQQRIALARALVFEPKVLLMDEPLGALDKQLREYMQYEIKHLHKRLGITIVYVTHDQSEALTLSDRIAVFNDGNIQQLATPTDLYEKPNNSFVAQFIGGNNRIAGRVISIVNGKARIETKGGSFDALAVHCAAGEATSVSIRPERVSIDPTQADCVIDARIQEVIYLGDHIRLRVSALGSDEFIVKTPNQSNQRKFKSGDIVRIGWAAEDGRALDA